MAGSRVVLGAICSLICLITFPVWASAQETLSLSTLLQHWPKPLASQPFKETRYDTLLDLTNRYDGVFNYKNQSDLSIVYSAPIKGRIDFKGQKVTVVFPSKTQTVSLTQLPQIKRFIEPIIALLSGNIQKLTTENKVELSSADTNTSQKGWVLTLTPKEDIVLTAKAITVKGTIYDGHPVISSIKLNFANGDWREFQLDNTHGG